ncbi:MAG: transglycosylase SLT domain-containing protein [Sulfurovum sp.]|nr:transglycosylase SLT domain-containing protein [Sulfurovum sp.]
MVIRTNRTTFTRQMPVLFTLLFLSTTAAEAAYTKIAEHAGLNHQTFEKIVKKIVKIESTTGSYHIENKKSGAYGRYQIMPKTARHYTQKLGIPYSQWKQPRNQDRIFQAILKSNIRELKKNGIKITAFSIYGAHQQGVGGFNAIMKNKKLTRSLERNLRYNLPNKLRKTDRSRLVTVWKEYWQEKLA